MDERETTNRPRDAATQAQSARGPVEHGPANRRRRAEDGVPPSDSAAAAVAAGPAEPERQAPAPPPFDAAPDTVPPVLDPGMDASRVRGWPVVTADGARVGTVGEVREQFFALHRPGRPDGWLSRTAVAATQWGTVVLRVPGDALAQVVVDGEEMRLQEREAERQAAAPAGSDAGSDAAALARVRPGWSVYTRDGVRLGEVERVAADAVLVDPPVGEAYTLPQRLVYAVVGRDVVLRLTKAELDTQPDGLHDA